MPLTGNIFAYGLREIRVVRDDAMEILPAAQSLQFTERVNTAELKGNDRVVVSNTVVEAITFQFNNGGIPLDAYALMTGRTMADTGTTPAQKTTLTIEAGDSFPWFTLYGKSIGDEGDDVHVKLYKCKLTAGVSGQLQGDNFYISQMSGIAIDDGTGKIADIVRNETSTDLPEPA